MPYLGLIYLVILVIALIDIIKTDDAAVRGLPKFAWVILVVMLPLVGALVWLAVGRPAADERPHRQDSGAASEFPEYDHPGRYVPQDPEADREFCSSCEIAPRNNVRPPANNNAPPTALTTAISHRPLHRA